MRAATPLIALLIAACATDAPPEPAGGADAADVSVSADTVGPSDTAGPTDSSAGDSAGPADLYAPDAPTDTAIGDTSMGPDTADDVGLADATDPTGDADTPLDGTSGDAGTPADAVPSDTAPDVAPPTWEENFDHVFPQDHVVELKLSFPAGEWEALLVEWQQLEQKNEHEASLDFDDEHVASVGVRLKGLNSLNVPSEGPIPLAGKYPLKVDFNTFGGPRFHEVDEINLGVNIDDPSLMRERLSERVYAAMGVPASRSSHGRLTIDGQPVGLYTMVQVIDKRFLKERFGTAAHADDGNLYKCVHNNQNICSLAWRGDTKEDYIQAEDCVPGYETCGLLLKTNKDDPALNDYADLIHLIDVLNHTPEDQFTTAIEQVFDVGSFLRLMAVAFVVGNWDSYFGKGHNFYLYHRPDTGRFMMLPWDLDLTYQGSSCSPDPTAIQCWGGDQKPLVARLLAVPAYEAQLVAYVEEVVDDHLTLEVHGPWISEMDALLAPLVGDDPNLVAAQYHMAVDPQGTDPQNLYRWVEERHATLSGKP